MMCHMTRIPCPPNKGYGAYVSGLLRDASIWFRIAGLGQLFHWQIIGRQDGSHDESDDPMLAQDNLARVVSRIDPMRRYETSIVI